MGGPNDELPVGRFSPVRGLIVDRTGRSVEITGQMELYGSEANVGRAASIQRSINTTWTRTFTDGYTISCSISVRYRGADSHAGNAAQIEADRTWGPSHVNALTREMTLNANEADAFTWTPAHEFGHVIGLKDRYSETIMSSIRGTFGGRRETPPDHGYEGNLMGVTNGVLQQQNVADVAAENEPSPYWLNDDDQVRDWVNAHSSAEIGQLSTADKLRAIWVL
jgi:hypothetical protein